MGQQNDWGIYKGDLDAGTASWVATESPLTFGDADHCIDNLSEDVATGKAAELTISQGEAFAPGRPKRKPHQQI